MSLETREGLVSDFKLKKYVYKIIISSNHDFNLYFTGLVGSHKNQRFVLVN